MKLGEAIPASDDLNRALRSAVEGVLQEKGAAAAALRDIIEKQTAVVTQLAATVTQLSAAADSLASASRMLSMRTTMPAPEVNLTVPETQVSVAAPVVNVEAPTVNVVESDGPERVVRTVERDRDGLILRIIETNG